MQPRLEMASSRPATLYLSGAARLYDGIGALLTIHTANTPRRCDADAQVALECLLIADDLTGACDAAVHFALRGYQTEVSVSHEFCVPDAAVAAICTNSRDWERDRIPCPMAQLASRLPFHSARVLFKKIDSTLRGNVGWEIAVLREAFGCDAVVVTPSLPAMRRVVEDGILRVCGDANFQPIDVMAWLRAQGAESCAAVKPGGIVEAIASGVQVVSVDAACDEDLDRIAAQAPALGRRVLWAGSAGLAAALARSLPAGNWFCESGLTRAAQKTFPSRDREGALYANLREQVPGNHALPRRGGVLFCVGSDHPVTLTQQKELTAGRAVVQMAAEDASGARIAAALRRGEHVLLNITRGLTTAAALRDLVAAAPAAGMLLSGGDTAAMVCQAAMVRRINCCDEIVPGIPRGILRGGPLNGMAVATKSGGFGDGDALIQVGDFFSCLN